MGVKDMQTFMDTQKNALLRKYHAMLRKGGISNEEKLSMLASYGVESGKDLNIYELTELCGKLDRMVNSKDERDIWRKRLIAAIGGYLVAMGKKSDITVIKGIACRAAGKDNFNAIPEDRLKSLYNAFKHRSNDIRAIGVMAAKAIDIAKQGNIIAEA